MNEKLMVMVLSILSAAAAFINILFIFIICKSRKLRAKSSTVFIVNLLVTHLIQALLVIPFFIMKRQAIDLEKKKIVCDGFRFSFALTFYGMCLHVLIISIDRLLAVKLLTSYKLIITFNRSVYVTIAAWIYIISLCLVPFIPQGKSTCSYNPQNEWTIFMLLTSTLMPYVIVVMIYLFIYKKLDEIATRRKKHSTASTRSTASIGDHVNRNFVKQSVIITSLYGLTWAPAVVYDLLSILVPSIFPTTYFNSTLEEYITFFIVFTTFLNSVVAPIVYGYFNADFKKEYKRTVRRCVSCKRELTRKQTPQGDITMTSIEVRDNTVAGKNKISRIVNITQPTTFCYRMEAVEINNTH